MKANAGRLIAVVLVVGVFAFVLPRVADYGDVWDVLARLEHATSSRSSRRRCSTSRRSRPPWMAALPGLSFIHALVMSQASTAASSVLPGGDAVGMAISYSMLRHWGFRSSRSPSRTAATAVWNAFANVVFAVAAAGSWR